MFLAGFLGGVAELHSSALHNRTPFFLQQIPEFFGFFLGKNSFPVKFGTVLTSLSSPQFAAFVLKPAESRRM